MLRAVLLAAGSGRRLGVAHPKCLLRFDGRSLLRRHVETLGALGVQEIGIVTGYERGQIEAELVDVTPAPTLRFNPDFARGSVLSAHCAHEWLTKGDDVLLMDADVLYVPELLERLARARGDALLLDRAFDDTAGEAMKVCLSRGRIVEFRKRIAADLRHDDVGESVGFFRLSAPRALRLAEQIVRYVEAGGIEEPYEEPLRDVLLAAPGAFEILDATGKAWIEIDFPEDVERARTRVLPLVRAAETERA
jgi:choline kinase